MLSRLANIAPKMRSAQQVRPISDLVKTVAQLMDVTPSREWFWPRVDVSETPDRFLVKAELPGVKREDIKINLDNRGRLSIRGRNHMEKVEDSEHFHRVERSFGEFRRDVWLPSGVKKDAVKASMKDGILVVEAPKPKKEKPDYASSEIKIEDGSSSPTNATEVKATEVKTEQS
eukprot:TRINITY_DN3403_c0_g1_i2.p1 TRINITY_DN3403_c0_g1~~TRINITY_DN3403_c0_g1_i2.p1  ORF type:complete len:174 (+),score=24.99 TRINITY_DN3403_c0_g1_i2:63-584(+)